MLRSISFLLVPTHSFSFYLVLSRVVYFMLIVVSSRAIVSLTLRFMLRYYAARALLTQ